MMAKAQRWPLLSAHQPTRSAILWIHDPQWNRVRRAFPFLSVPQWYKILIHMSNMYIDYGIMVWLCSNTVYVLLFDFYLIFLSIIERRLWCFSSQHTWILDKALVLKVFGKTWPSNCWNAKALGSMNKNANAGKSTILFSDPYLDW